MSVITAVEVQGKSTRSIPRHHSRLPGGSLWNLRTEPLEFLPRLTRQYGDVVSFQAGPVEIVLVNDPELIREVLVTQDRRFMKGPGLRVAERLLGKGLLTSEGAFHRRQRRLAQPAFHRARIAGYASVMASYTHGAQAAWQDGVRLDLSEEMRGLTLRIAAKTLFDTEVDEEIQQISHALDESLSLFQWATLPFAGRLERFLPFLTRRFKEARAALDASVYRIIRERRASGEDRGDLLSMLILAQDVDEDGGQMTDEQIRDEAMTLLLAGHETTANAFAWTFYLLAQNPEVEARLHTEVDAVLGGRLPGVEDVPNLPYTRQVFAEGMRCYPPAWVVVRKAVEDCPLGPYTVPEGSLVMMSPWTTHHDARHYPEPFKFDPDRWTPDAVAERPKFSYFPFGGGSRLCIGEQFAWMEGVLVLATLAARWQIRAVPGVEVKPQPLITLRPRGGMPMVPHLRTACHASEGRE